VADDLGAMSRAMSNRPATARPLTDTGLYRQVVPIRCEQAFWLEILQTSLRTSPKTSKELGVTF
jgi:hypothetical protein